MTIGYLAGLIDGEGYVGITTARASNSKSLSYNGRLIVANTNPRLMTWLIDHVGGKCYVQRKNQGLHRGWKPRFTWTLTGHNLERVLRVVLPHLVLKRQQAETVLELRELQTRIGRRTPTTDQLATKAGMKARIHVLNGRGAVSA